MWPLVLGSAALGGLAGGIQGYQQSGGNLGATLRSALGGGVVGGLTGGLGVKAGGMASRFAGQALQPMLGELAATPGVAGSAASLLSKNLPKIAGGVAGAGTSLAAGALLSPVAAAAANLTGQAVGGTAKAARAALGFATKGEPGTGAYPGGAVPDLNDPLFGNRVLGSNIMDAYDVAGNFATIRALQRLQAQTELENLKLIEPYKAQMLEGRSKAEFQRNMAAAALRQNIATQAALLQGGIGAAQQMGLQASQDIGRGLTQQYQYS